MTTEAQNLIKGSEKWLGQLQSFTKDWPINHEMLGKIIITCLIFFITFYISQHLANTVRKTARKYAHTEADRTLPEFISQVLRWLVLLIGFVLILNQLGLETASFVTVLGAASLAIGLALQGTLGNVAAGLMILLNKPFVIGHTIKFGEFHGKVHRIGLFSSEIDTFDGMRIFVPNAKLFGNEVTNVSTHPHVRLELKIPLDHESDSQKAVLLLKALIDNHPACLSQPAAWVGLHEITDQSLVVRALLFCDAKDLIWLRADLLRSVLDDYRTNAIKLAQRA